MPAVVNCAAKEDVTVPPVPMVSSKPWKLSFDSGIVNTPLIGTLLPVRLSHSVPEITNEATELAFDRFVRSSGD